MPPAKQNKFRAHRPNAMLREDVAYLPASPGGLKIHKVGEGEQELRYVEDVKIIGFKSRGVPGGRHYRPEGMPLELYEGVNVNVDHPDPQKKSPRLFTDRFGWVQGVYQKPDGYYAKKLFYNPRHNLTESFEWWAANAPNRIGLSQNAVGDVFEAFDGSEYVNKITQVRSIDLVADPATTTGLFEAMNWDPPTRLQKAVEFRSRPLREGDGVDDSPAIPGIEGPGQKKRPPDTATGPGGGDASGPDSSSAGSGTDLGLQSLLDDTGSGDSGSSALGDADNDGVPNAEDSTPAGDVPDSNDFTPELISAATKIFNSQMDIKDKLSKIKSLLMMHPAHSSVKESLFMNANINSLNDAKKVMTRVAKNSTAARLIMEALDTMEVREQRALREARVEEIITQSRIETDLVTPYFRSQLLECRNDSEVLAAIDDRRKVAGAGRRNSRPTSFGPDPSGTDKPLQEAFAPPPTDNKEKAEEAFKKFEQFALSGVSKMEV